MKKTIPERTLDNGYDVVVVAQAVAKLLRETTHVPIGGELIELTYAEALARRTLHDALNGNARARRDVIEFERIAAEYEKQSSDRDLDRAIRSLTAGW